MRKSDYEVLELARTRWSPKAYRDEKVPLEEVRALIEAATMAPSCYNEQPWRFIIFQDDDQVEKMKTFLTDANKLWNGPVRNYVLILTRDVFEYNGKENKWSSFDAGAAWGMFSLEAERRGLITHAMAGFARKAVKQYLDIHEQMTPLALIAVGKYGDPEQLEASLQEKEHPKTRKSVDEVVLDIRFED